MVKPIPPEGAEMILKARHVGIHKKGSGASLDSEALLVDKVTGETYYILRNGTFLVGAKGFKDSGVTLSQKIKPPARAPDMVVDVATSKEQAQIYRLSGDYNPLHVDPDFATMAGFGEPIMHGLCSLGMSCSAVLEAMAGNDPTRFKALNVRFASPVLPGQTLSVEMWKEGSRIIFITKVKETGKVCLSNGIFELTPEAKL